MRRTFPLTLAILTAFCLARADAGWFDGWRRRPCPCQTVPIIPEVTPEEAVRRVLNEQVEAWNKGDLEGFMTGYWNSPDLSFSSGKDRTRGWQATMERYVKRYRSDGNEMGKLTFSELDVDVLSHDAALVRGRWHLKRSKDELGGLFTLIFKRLPEGWRIVHDHTSG
jgi:ketosteroid isomerase-like protein